MVDRKKVIKGLDLCLSGDNLTCKDCPYYVECLKAKGIGPSPLRRDALALLKEQEARVLDWDEIKNYPVVYGEFKGVSAIYPLIITCDNKGRALSWNPGINVSDEYLLLVSDEEDRKNTRCWNRMPTDEQRQEVRW